MGTYTPSSLAKIIDVYGNVNYLFILIYIFYSEGIYDDVSCSSTSVNHAMLLIGFDKDFWILKNWWGELWGEAGFMRMRKGINLCGIANYAAYAIV